MQNWRGDLLRRWVRATGAAMAAGVLGLMLAGCTAGAGSHGSVAELAPPPATIAPFNGNAHQLALQDPHLQAAIELGKKGDFVPANAKLQPLADAGNPIAQHLLGGAYLFGNGVAKDPAIAARWLHAAALQGYALSQSYLGDQYQKASGVTHDLAMANRWYRFAAEQGEDVATGRLAISMLDGEGIAGYRRRARAVAPKRHAQ